jgi:hypothetical protein
MGLELAGLRKGGFLLRITRRYFLQTGRIIVHQWFFSH